MKRLRTLGLEPELSLQSQPFYPRPEVSANFFSIGQALYQEGKSVSDRVADVLSLQIGGILPEAYFRTADDSYFVGLEPYARLRTELDNLVKSSNPSLTFKISCLEALIHLNGIYARTTLSLPKAYELRITKLILRYFASIIKDDALTIADLETLSKLANQIQPGASFEHVIQANVLLSFNTRNLRLTSEAVKRSRESVRPHPHLKSVLWSIELKRIFPFVGNAYSADYLKRCCRVLLVLRKAEPTDFRKVLTAFNHVLNPFSLLNPFLNQDSMNNTVGCAFEVEHFQSEVQIWMLATIDALRAPQLYDWQEDRPFAFMSIRSTESLVKTILKLKSAGNLKHEVDLSCPRLRPPTVS